VIGAARKAAMRNHAFSLRLGNEVRASRVDRTHCWIRASSLESSLSNRFASAKENCQRITRAVVQTSSEPRVRRERLSICNASCAAMSDDARRTRGAVTSERRRIESLAGTKPREWPLGRTPAADVHKQNVQIKEMIYNSFLQLKSHANHA
jgi:hypothetical protein